MYNTFVFSLKSTGERIGIWDTNRNIKRCPLKTGSNSMHYSLKFSCLKKWCPFQKRSKVIQKKNLRAFIVQIRDTICIFLYTFSVGCRAIGKLAGIEGTDVYCLRNCFHNGAKNCPKDECECYGADDENEVSIEPALLDW